MSKETGLDVFIALWYATGVQPKFTFYPSSAALFTRQQLINNITVKTHFGINFPRALLEKRFVHLRKMKRTNSFNHKLRNNGFDKIQITLATIYSQRWIQIPTYLRD